MLYGSAEKPAANPLEPESFPELAKILRSETTQILQRWDEVARAVKQVVSNLNLKQMQDDMPTILGMLADLLEGPTAQTMQTLVDRATRHGVARHRQHYDVPQLMSEGRLLRRVVVERIEEALRRQMSREESIALHSGIDVVLQGGILTLIHEQELSQRQTEQRYRLAVEQVVDYAIFMIDPQGRMASWNAGVRQVLGWEEADFLGRPFWVIFPTEDLPAVPEAELQEAREHGRAQNDRWQIRRDGTRFWASGITTAIRDEQGQLTGYLKVMRDLTEPKLNEQRLDQAKQQAEAASSAKDHFLATLSHELRTPLTPVVTTAGLLEQDPELPARYREDIGIIHRNVELEARLIDDLLDITRIVRGKLELNFAVVPLSQIIGHAVEVCTPDVAARRLHLGVDLGEATYYIHADPARLQQVFWNLLKNAIKFTPPGGCVGIRCQHNRADDHVIVQIIDSGKGIEAQLLPHLFRPFEQGGSHITRQFGGLGLGLTITRGLVELHRGTIEARSEGAGRGARFVVRLPVVSAPLVPTKQARTAGRSASARPARTPEQRKLRILLVEDHGDTARIMKRVLVADGHAVQTAGDVASALDLFGRNEFDLLLSDLGLPDGSGTDVVRSIREHGRTIPAIALSGYGQEEDVRRSKEAGFDEHLIKPVDLGRLKQTIRRLGQDAR